MNEEDILKVIRLNPTDLDHVPRYAVKEAVKAIIKVKDLEDNSLLHPGLHYVVLIDLCDSTKASSLLGPEINKNRIESFIKQTIQALSFTTLNNRAIFIEEIGDASLFLFSNFEDILNWSDQVDILHNLFNQRCDLEKKPDIFKMYSKKCIHLGEVFFGKSNKPIAYAVNQIFKIEKCFSRGQLGITELVRQAIIPLISSGQLHIELVNQIILPGDENVLPIWRIQRL